MGDHAQGRPGTFCDCGESYTVCSFLMVCMQLSILDVKADRAVAMYEFIGQALGHVTSDIEEVSV